MSETPLLKIDGLSRKFDSLWAVDDVSFTVDAGSFVGLIGPNGAGKSTLFDCITGVAEPLAGRVTFKGEDITGNSLEENVRLGLVRTFQQTRILERMTIRENLLVASQTSATPRKRADELLRTIELNDSADTLARDLSFGQQKLVSIAQSLMLDPDMLLLDEPFAGINPTMENEILALLHRFLTPDRAILLIEHDMDIVMSECEEVIVMNAGSILARGTPSEIQSDEQVISAYFGG